MKKGLILIASILLLGKLATAQDTRYAKRIINKLCAEEMAGRGYVNNGVNKAANYLGSEFRKLKLKKFKGSYFQSFNHPINTFPYPIKCTLDNKALIVGKDFLLAPDSGPCKGTYKLSHYNMNDSLEKRLYKKKESIGLFKNEIVVLQNKVPGFDEIPNDIKVQSLNKKLIHSLRPKATNSCNLIFHDSIIANGDSLYINAQNKEIDLFTSKNVIAYIPAKKKKNRNKYIVFTAHYDHLGKLGQAVFPGASDNASGSAMVLNLAKHYAKRSNEYSMVFILFAGEEAGLLGSDYFTSLPTFDISKIKMLINLDIMGSAEDGITVVNATEFPKQFATMKRINKRKGYLPKVKSRGPTQNSDHYHFYKKGIPSFFIYSMGGPGFYHDIYDTPASIPMANYRNVFRLLTDFVDSF